MFVFNEILDSNKDFTMFKFNPEIMNILLDGESKFGEVWVSALQKMKLEDQPQVYYYNTYDNNEVPIQTVSIMLEKDKIEKLRKLR